MSGFNVPIDSFNTGYCMVCANRDCTRSQSNSMIFDQRTQNWYKNLFSDVPRADINDVSFDNIRAKKFIQINETNTKEITKQVLHTDMKIEEPVMKEKDTVPVSQISSSVPVSQISSSLEPNTQIKEDIKQEKGLQTQELPQNVYENNTSFEQGSVIKQDGVSQELKDVIIKPGGSFTFE